MSERGTMNSASISHFRHVLAILAAQGRGVSERGFSEAQGTRQLVGSPRAGDGAKVNQARQKSLEGRRKHDRWPSARRRPGHLEGQLRGGEWPLGRAWHRITEQRGQACAGTCRASGQGRKRDHRGSRGVRLGAGVATTRLRRCHSGML